MEDSWLGMNKNNWVQFGFEVATFMLTIIAGVWFLAWTIGGVQLQNAAAITALQQTEQSARGVISERVATLEAEHVADHAQIDRLSTSIDKQSMLIGQQAEATNELTSAVAKLQQVLEDMRHR